MKELDKYDDTSQAILFLALTLMRSIDDTKNSITKNNGDIFPELLYLFDIKDIMKLAKIYGGKKINIPSINTIQKNMTLVIYLYCSVSLKWNNEKIKEILNMTSDEFRGATKTINRWKKYIQKNNITLPNCLIKPNSKMISELKVILSEANDGATNYKKTKIKNKYKAKVKAKIKGKFKVKKEVKRKIKTKVKKEVKIKYR